MATFDITFDLTFRGLLLTPSQPTVEGCRKPGIYLTWLAPTGWMYWLWEAEYEEQVAVSSLGTRRQAGLTLHNQKEAAELLRIRTVIYSRSEAKAVSTIYGSPGVYILAPDQANRFHAVRVEIEPGTFPVYSTASRVSRMETTLILPARRLQRA
ncbi:hypothetical protein DYU11_22605 [Fibrisoma montanum]|uniref:Uncharacterized protein n=1 Tax=Fibrisoma montanum TaxID=2305895 RepID=A0A418M1U8_9BACT|nr:hypothetical protein [Fibrisoma montanum]RIV19723.1 hypothetical protein DYU11_22605 [Fibrisoma montanum]